MNQLRDHGHNCHLLDGLSLQGRVIAAGSLRCDLEGLRDMHVKVVFPPQGRKDRAVVHPRKGGCSALGSTEGPGAGDPTPWPWVSQASQVSQACPVPCSAAVTSLIRDAFLWMPQDGGAGCAGLRGGWPQRTMPPAHLDAQAEEKCLRGPHTDPTVPVLPPGLLLGHTATLGASRNRGGQMDSAKSSQ